VRAEPLHCYHYHDAQATWANAYLWPVLRRVIAKQGFTQGRVLDLGCGNGATANMLAQLGFEVVGVDPSASGITQACQAFPDIRFERANAYDDLKERYGTFSLVVSLEVIEHCYDPRQFAQTVYDCLEDGGLGFISTPFHGYWKNLVLAVTGKWDDHLNVLWDGGHIKFFSVKTLGTLLRETGFRQISFLSAGRFPPLAKSMVAIVRK
jgi:2-polyprenyl-3-methyl-5-hydroxy-6-metoxy-1,4-benzoquinol methylase